MNDAPRKLLVLAGNFSQFRDWIRERQINPSNARYLGSVHHLMGIADADIVKVGLYYERKDYWEIYEVALRRAYFGVRILSEKEYLDEKAGQASKP